MKNILKTFAIGALLFSTAFIPLHAQNGEHPKSAMKSDYKKYSPEEKAQKVTDKISEKLQLSEAQKKEVYTLKLNDIKRREEIRKSEMENRKKSEANFRKILTPEQITKVDAMKAKREENKGQNSPKKPYGPRD